RPEQFRTSLPGSRSILPNQIRTWIVQQQTLGPLVGGQCSSSSLHHAIQRLEDLFALTKIRKNESQDWDWLFRLLLVRVLLRERRKRTGARFVLHCIVPLVVTKLGTSRFSLSSISKVNTRLKAVT